MIISGFQKMTLLDFPKKVACTVFTHGCNLRCPFCHNASLVLNTKEHPIYKEEEILSYLEKRKGLLDGVCITGGEPLLHKGIKDFIEKIKALGYAVKLDTNGCFPSRLKELVNEGLIDYVAMDIKNSFPKYGETVGIKNFNLEPVKESIEFLMNSGIDYEFRTTVVKELHEIEDIIEIAKVIKGASGYYLQCFTDSGDILGEGLSAHSATTLNIMAEQAKKYIDIVSVRGI